MNTLLGTPPSSPPLTTPRRALVVISGLLLVVVIAFGGLSLVAHYGQTTYTTSSDLAPKGQLVRVSTGSGNVEVHPSTDSRIHVESRVRYGFRRPQLEQSEGPDGIELSASCRWFDSACSIDYRIGLPAGLDIAVDTGSGDITATGSATLTTLSTGSGDISATGSSGVVDARTGSGDIKLRSSTSSTVTVKSGSGDISLEFREAPTEISARTGSGEISLRVPTTVAYAFDIDTGSGDKTVDVPTDPQAERHVFVRTGSGDVRVRQSAAG